MDSGYWLLDDKSGIKEAVFSKIYNRVERDNVNFSLTGMEETITRSFIGCLCN